MTRVAKTCISGCPRVIDSIRFPLQQHGPCRSISYEKLDPQAAKLFQLLSFLNPDGILIDFLESSVQVLEQDLRQVLSNPIDRAKALIELEKFSLIKWDRSGEIDYDSSACAECYKR